MLDHGLPPCTPTVYLQPTAMAEGHGGGGGMSLCHLVGWVWLGGGEVSMAQQADEGRVHTYLQPTTMAEGHGGGGGMSLHHLVGWVWLGGGKSA